MAGPRFADLEKQGKPIQFDELVRGGGTVTEAPSKVESGVRGAYQGASFNLADEGTGALEALGGHLKRTFTNDWENSNRKVASALHSSVLPTPVGPRNMKEPYGRPGSPRPARERRIASDTATMASC